MPTKEKEIIQITTTNPKIWFLIILANLKGLHPEMYIAETYREEVVSPHRKDYIKLLGPTVL